MDLGLRDRRILVGGASRGLGAAIAEALAAEGARVAAVARPSAELSATAERIGGFAMFLLAVFLFAGFHTVDEKGSPLGFLLVWITVFILLFLIVVLAYVDVRLTARLRRRRLNPPS